MQHVGIYLPKTLVSRIDQAKGYYTKTKFLQKIIEEYLANQENELEAMMTVSATSAGERVNKK
jgi:metal-responsive CopG/Arc/MetJ family transcriptional regulator